MHTQFQIEPATRYKSRLRLALAGAPGSGKTYTSLLVATTLASHPSKIVVIDTEGRSAAKYAKNGRGEGFEFMVLPLRDHHPDTVADAIRYCEEQGYEVIVIDSLSDAYEGHRGVLETANQISATTLTSRGKPDSFAGWNQMTPKWRELLQRTIGESGCHVIATFRVEAKRQVIPGPNGQLRMTKPIEKIIAKGDPMYWFDVAGEMDEDHSLKITKSRIGDLQDRHIDRPGEEFALTLHAWLDEGVEAPAIPKTADELRSELNRLKQRVAERAASEGCFEVVGEQKSEYARRLAEHFDVTLAELSDPETLREILNRNPLEVAA